MLIFIIKYTGTIKTSNTLPSNYLGNASKHHVLFVSGKATRIPDIKGECRMTPPIS